MTTAATGRWKADRKTGLDRLRVFSPRAGYEYERARNFDTGNGNHNNVSCLSPWIRHRLVLEEEVLRSVLHEHSPAAARKFIQELLWRTYWKGWLEMRPQVWRDYREALRDFADDLQRGGELRRHWERATGGHTAIECYDHWVRELLETGYLHNHARMWFASIWIFTLKLPWQLGADFFLRHLLDGDAAANTLSWRWVAGLQTPGKTYLARAENIARYTGGRFNPRGQLNEHMTPVPQVAPVPPRPLPAPVRPASNRRSGLLICDDDLCAETLELSDVHIVAVAAFSAVDARSTHPVSGPVSEFSEQALKDGMTRAGQHFEAPLTHLNSGELHTQLEAWARNHQLSQVLLPYVPLGPAHDALQSAMSTLDCREVRVAQLRRPWDEHLWPHASRGYFNFKKSIEILLPNFLQEKRTDAGNQ